MYLDTQSTTKNGKTYRYARLVRSVRIKGKLSHVVIAKLGQLSDLQIQNLKLALKAAREGKTLLLPPEHASLIAPIPIDLSLRFLDIAVLLALWARLQLNELFHQLFPDDLKRYTELTLFSLVAQRCLAPASKFSATRWFPTTALPELTALPPDKFHNTRIHRVLDSFSEVLDPLINSLPLLLRSRRGPVSACFLDVTDTFFEGLGPPSAGRAKTKEGLANKRKIGIALLCDPDGFPLRWSVLPGKEHEALGMRDHILALKRVSWLGDAPIICDRAMGQLTHLAFLLDSGLRFLTAVPRSQIDSHQVSVPFGPFFEFVPSAKEDPSDEMTRDKDRARKAFDFDVARLRALALDNGLTRVDDTLFVIDLGVQERPLAQHELPWVGPDDLDPEKLTGAASLLAWARIFRRLIDAQVVKNRADLAALVDVSRARITEIMNLLKLDVSLQDELLAGRFGALAEHRVRQVLKLSGIAAQREALEALASDKEIQSTARKLRPKKIRTTQNHPVRYVAYFNPEMYLAQYLRVERLRRSLEAFTDELNGRLRSPFSQLTVEDAYYALRRKRDDLGLNRLFTITVKETRDEHERPCLRATAQFQPEEWERKRRYLGFVLLVGHSELPQDASDLARLYRAKDAVERDFRVIKDHCEIRPVYHHTDPKVRAHVSICMLALLLKRELEAQLRGAGRPMSAKACLEVLAPCHLNRHEKRESLESLYSVTVPTTQQTELLKSLGLSHLVEDRKVAELITARPA